MLKDNIIIWDFEGTLAVRSGRFAGALIGAAKSIDQNFVASAVDLRALLFPAFPWNTETLQHHYATDPDAWWANIERCSTEALQQFGFSL